MLGSLTLLWCGGILVYSWARENVPNNSLFPEFDFAAKVAHHKDDGMGGCVLLNDLGNGSTSDIKKRVKEKSFFVRDISNLENGSTGDLVRRVRITEMDSGERLTPGKHYV